MAENENKTDPSLAVKENALADATVTSDNTKQVSSPESSATLSASHPSHTGLWLGLAVTLCLTLAVGAAGYWFVWKKQGEESVLANRQSEQQNKISQLDTQNAELQRQLVALSQSKQALQDAISKLGNQSDALTLKTDQALAEIQSMDGRRPSDWLLAEADYLVRMAGRKLWLEKDVRTAVLLLKNANTRLSELSDPSLIPVRGLLAEDIQRLQQVRVVDKTSIALALASVISNADKHPIDTFQRPESADANAALSESVSDWKENLAKVWHSIVDDFISVTRSDEPVEPLMTQEQQWLHREQLKLKLMQAQSAVLSADNALYRQALDGAVAILQEHFDGDDPGVTGTITTLTSLREQDIRETLPETLSAAEPLKRLLDKRVEGAFGDGETL